MIKVGSPWFCIFLFVVLIVLISIITYITTCRENFIDETKLDKNKIEINVLQPVYITLTTIPSRMENTFRIINNFLQNVTGFEKIIINIPYKYQRWPQITPNPETYSKNINDPRLIINRCNDYGPLTKILPSINLIPSNSITIISDDMCYHLDSFNKMATAVTKRPNEAISYYIYKYNKLKIPQGADIIGIQSKNLKHLPQWFNNQSPLQQFNTNNPCFYVDDQILAWYFKHLDIPVTRLNRDHTFVYIKNCNEVSGDDLNRQTGSRSRVETMRMCYGEFNG